MNLVQTIRPQEALAPAIGAAILDLATLVWPSAEEEAPLNFQTTLNRWRSDKSAHFLVREDNKIRAHALIFRRELLTQSGPLPVGALATVCVHPDFRGRNWGADIVRAAFDFLPELGVEVSLFQTGVPHFYQKLGARRISNRFFNGNDPKTPFWDGCEMIFPASFAWPEGDIDLNGPGY